MNHPPDRSGIATERRNPRSVGLDTRSVGEIARLINAEDATVPMAVERAMPRLVAFIEELVPRVQAGGRLIYLGAGTSGRLGVLDASECPPTFCAPGDLIVGLIAGGDGALRRSSEGMEDDPRGADDALRELGLSDRDTLLGIAAGGTTPYVVGGLEFARARGAMTGFLVCTPLANSPAVDHLITIDTGPEVVTGSTRMKAGTATKLALNTITTTLFVRLGKVHDNLMVDVRATNAKLRDRAARIVAELTGLSREECFALLEEAGGSAKAAAVMHRRGLPRHRAEQLLALHLRAALEAPSAPDATEA
jgi:N-acetylmuramic acid 6-phosphate etherase